MFIAAREKPETKRGAHGDPGSRADNFWILYMA